MDISDLWAYFVIGVVSFIFLYILAYLALPGWQIFATIILAIDAMTPLIQHVYEAGSMTASVYGGR
jgi:hypothetical protein